MYHENVLRSQQLATEIEEKEAIMRKLTKQSRTVNKMKRGDQQTITAFYIYYTIYVYNFNIYYTIIKHNNTYINIGLELGVKGSSLCLSVCIYVNDVCSIPACYRRVCRDVTEAGHGARTQASC